MLPVWAKSIPSPDGRYRVQVGATVEVVDSSGQSVLLVDKDVAGVQRVEVSWSPDSSRVVVAENFGRGSGIFAAWREGPAWHKTLESDEDQAGVIKAAQRQGLGRLVADQRTLGNWVSTNALTVKGEMTFSGGKRAAYTYTLEFEASPRGNLDRGGYEEGVIRGRNFRSE
jgi:hypothetical protein